MNSLWNKIKLSLEVFRWRLGALLFYGDKAIFGKNNEDEEDKVKAEVGISQENVYKDLMKEQVTEKVRELRHEMYFSERESYHYEYKGGGLAEKKGLFDYSGEYENSDGHKLSILQPNILDNGKLFEGKNLKEILINATKTAREYKYTISIERDFIPRFKLEEYTNRLVVKKIDDENVILDFYTTIYNSQFNRIHKPFLNEIERLKNGDLRSEIIDFKKASFISFNAYGTDDLMFYSFKDFKFIGVTEFDGNYVLKFDAKIETYGEDLIKEFYDEKTAEKNRIHAPREGYSYDMSSDIGREERENEAEKIINFLKKNEQE